MKIISLLFVLAMVLTGCTTPSKKVPATPPLAQPVTDKRITVDPAIANAIQITKVDLSEAGRFARLQINVQNASRALARFTYTIIWLDKDGNTIPAAVSYGAPWTLLGGEKSQLIVTSPSPLAKTFKAQFSAVGA